MIGQGEALFSAGGGNSSSSSSSLPPLMQWGEGGTLCKTAWPWPRPQRGTVPPCRGGCLCAVLGGLFLFLLALSPATVGQGGGAVCGTARPSSVGAWEVAIMAARDDPLGGPLRGVAGSYRASVSFCGGWLLGSRLTAPPSLQWVVLADRVSHPTVLTLLQSPSLSCTNQGWPHPHSPA